MDKNYLGENVNCGGYRGNTSNAGVFSFTGTYPPGSGDSGISFRLVLKLQCKRS